MSALNNDQQYTVPILQWMSSAGNTARIHLFSMLPTKNTPYAFQIRCKSYYFVPFKLSVLKHNIVIIAYETRSVNVFYCHFRHFSVKRRVKNEFSRTLKLINKKMGIDGIYEVCKVENSFSNYSEECETTITVKY